MLLLSTIYHLLSFRVKHARVASFLVCLAMLAGQSCAQTILFADDFNTPESYHEALTKNATTKEYGENALASGHLLKKWNYSWSYAYDSAWTQAFYVVPDGKDYMEQAGRSAAPGNYRLVTNTAVPERVKKYEIQFKQRKSDNDPVFFHIGTDAQGNGGIKFGYENQLPGSDKTVDSVYTRGDLGTTMIPGKAYFRRWAEHSLTVDVRTKEVTWKVNGEVILSAQVEQLKPGGHFALSQHYERGTRYDDVKIIALE